MPDKRAGADFAAALDHCLHDAVWRERKLIEVDANGVGHRVHQGRWKAGEGAFARLLGAERAVRIVCLDNVNVDRR